MIPILGGNFLDEINKVGPLKRKQRSPVWYLISIFLMIEREINLQKRNQLYFESSMNLSWNKSILAKKDCKTCFKSPICNLLNLCDFVKVLLSVHVVGTGEIIYRKTFIHSCYGEIHEKLKLLKKKEFKQKKLNLNSIKKNLEKKEETENIIWFGLDEFRDFLVRIVEDNGYYLCNYEGKIIDISKLPITVVLKGKILLFKESNLGATARKV